jgi:hypothetical protein
MALILSADSIFNKYLTEDSANASAKLLQYLQSQTVFVEAGITDDGTVWAQFKDGRVYCAINNLLPEPDGTIHIPPPPHHARKGNSDPQDMEFATQYRAQETLGSGFDSTLASDISQYMDNANYQKVNHIRSVLYSYSRWYGEAFSEGTKSRRSFNRILYSYTLDRRACKSSRRWRIL